ncbi:MAG: hypothetical protein AAFP07_04225 [Cyanobacteria bacterium J06606_4]
MSSPFTTLEDFSNAIEGPTGGAIYTFANAPAINAIALLVAVGIFLWFIVATYSTHASPSGSMDNSLNHLSSFLVLGLLSAITAAGHYANRAPRPEQAMTQHRPSLKAVHQQTSKKLPLGLLGMAGIGLPSLSRTSKRKARSKRSAYRSERYRPRR